MINDIAMTNYDHQNMDGKNESEIDFYSGNKGIGGVGSSA
jgi:hypothetical protein